MSNYSFPILPNPEIISCLTEMGFQFTKEELNQPTSAKVREFCEEILCIYSGYNKSQSQQPLHYAIDKLSQPELFIQDGAIGEITFLRAISSLMKTVGFHDFTYKDIYKPEAIRVRKMFSGIINLGKFMELKISRWNELKNENTALADENSIANLQEKKLIEELDDLRCKKIKKDQTIRNLADQLQQDEQRLKKLVQYQNEQRKIMLNKINQNDTIKQDIENIKTTIENTNEECSRMEALIVPSPDKIKKVLEDMKYRLAQRKEGLKDFEPTMSKLQNKFKQLEKINKNIQTTLELVDNYQKENKSYKTTKKSTKELIKVSQDQKKQMNDLDNDIKKFKEDVDKIEENLKKNKEVYKIKKAELINTQGELKNQKALIEKERESTQIKIDQYIKELDLVRTSIAQLKSNYEKERIAIYKSFCSLVDSIHSYHLQLFNLMENGRLPDNNQFIIEQQQQTEYN